jgi:hypothetical protein
MLPKFVRARRGRRSHVRERGLRRACPLLRHGGMRGMRRAVRRGATPRLTVRVSLSFGRPLSNQKRGNRRKRVATSTRWLGCQRNKPTRRYRPVLTDKSRRPRNRTDGRLRRSAGHRRTVAVRCTRASCSHTLGSGGPPLRERGIAQPYALALALARLMLPHGATTGLAVVIIRPPSSCFPWRAPALPRRVACTPSTSTSIARVPRLCARTKATRLPPVP